MKKELIKTALKTDDRSVSEQARKNLARLSKMKIPEGAVDKAKSFVMKDLPELSKEVGSRLTGKALKSVSKTLGAGQPNTYSVVDVVKDYKNIPRDVLSQARHFSRSIGKDVGKFVKWIGPGTLEKFKKNKEYYMPGTYVSRKYPAKYEKGPIPRSTQNVINQAIKNKMPDQKIKAQAASNLAHMEALLPTDRIVRVNEILNKLYGD